MSNLSIAFPEKTEKERLTIAKAFYKNFVDGFIETIKLVSISDAEFDKRFVVDSSVLNNLLPTGQSVQIHSGHFFNWEFLNLGIAKNSAYPFIGVYTALTNQVFDKIIYKIRSRYKTILISSSEFRTKFHQYTNQPYCLGLVADQNPVNPENAYWVPFFGRMTPFFKGPEKGAKNMNTAIVMANLFKVERGHYRMDYTLLTTEPKATKEGFITKSLINFIEAAIRERPDNYLWSHRRWKFPYDEKKYAKFVI